jgi:hypothetical protein
MADQPEETNRVDGWFYLLFLSIILVAATLPSAVLAVGFRVYVLPRLRKLEKISLLVLASSWLLSAPITRGRDYIDWVKAVVGKGDANVVLDLPIITFTSLGLIYAIIWSLLNSTTVSTKIPFSFPNLPWRQTPESPSTGVLPTETERELSISVVATGKSLTVDPQSNAATVQHEVGKREFPLGADKYGQPVMISESEIRYHGLLFGSTGSGKTETIKNLMGSLLDLGWDGCILDLKEDTGPGGLSDWCRDYADYHALPYQELALSSSDMRVWFNPLYGMGPDEARDTIVGSQQFDDGYYRSLNEKQLGQLIRLTYAANSIDPTRYPAPSVYDLGKILSSPNLAAATKDMVATVIANNPTVRKEEFDSLIRPDEAMAKAAGGLGARLTALYETEVARRALRPGEGKTELDISQPGLTYIGLSSSAMPAISRLVSAAVLRRMSVFAADRITGKIASKKPRFLIIDEANFVNRTLLLELLSRARSAWIPVIVCTQGPTDWNATTPGEAGLASLVQNTNVNIILSQGELSNAEMCADIIGRSEMMRYSTTMRDGELLDGSGSARSSIEHLVSPDDLRRLKIGEAVIRIGKPSERVTWVKIPQRDARNRPGKLN